jgi:hypothetical protein
MHCWGLFYNRVLNKLAGKIVVSGKRCSLTASYLLQNDDDLTLVVQTKLLFLACRS